jgi:hypothetical protein
MEDALATVREIALKEHRGELKGDALINRCTEVALILRDHAHASDFAEAIWHYLFDADIRVKDPEYGAQQLSNLMEVVGLAPK